MNNWAILLTALFALASPNLVVADESIVDFESAEIGKPIPQWTEQEVVFELAHVPKKSKALGRIMFFPHIGSGKKGILNAMANEPIPIRVTFPRPVSRVRLKLWGSTTSASLIEAFDANGKVIAKDSLEQVPTRTKPEEHVPFFDATLQGDSIAYLEVSGSQPGGFLAIDEMDITYFGNESVSPGK